MRLRSRLARLERRDVPRSTRDPAPRVEIWMPENDRDGRPLGDAARLVQPLARLGPPLPRPRLPAPRPVAHSAYEDRVLG